MSDLISRQEMIDWDTIAYLSDIRAKYDCNDEEERRYYRACSKAIDALRHMPTAEPKRGKWDFIGNNMFKCTCCGTAYTTQQLNGLRNYSVDPYAPNYCPNCGADMRGEENETD